ncbi:MAG: hypothetical protein ACSHWW_12715 [Nonlabens sp.]
MTKFMAIYAAFHIVTIVFKTYADSLSEESTILEAYQTPIYVVAGVHLMMLLICGAMIMFEKYFWVVTIACIMISLYTRFYFDDIVTWINNF